MGKHLKEADRKGARLVPLILVVVLIFLALMLYRSNRILEIEEFPLVFEELPSGFDGFTIAHLSDLHGINLEAFTPDLLPALREIRPDCIAITGDLIDNRNDIPWIYDAVKALVDIAPVFYVSGNHEFGTRQFPLIESELKEAGATVLRNQAYRIERGGEELVILGIEDPAGPVDMLPMEEVVGLVRESGASFFVTLHHRYDRFEEFAELGLPLVLVGHAHGGLIRLPGTDGLFGPGRKIFPERTNGLYTEGATSMIASRGLGNASYTFRLFSYPHVPVIRLYSKEP